MLLDPPDWPRELSEMPRLKTCGSCWISCVVVTAPEASTSARLIATTDEPTGAAPRTRLPVTTMSDSPAGACANATLLANIALAAAACISARENTDARRRRSFIAAPTR